MALTIDNWLLGKVDYDVPTLTIEGILAEEEIVSGTLFADLTQRQKDLALADLYLWIATSSTSSSGEYESDGGWQRQKSAKNIVDRGWFKSEAARLRAKWITDDTTSGGITFKDLY